MTRRDHTVSIGIGIILGVLGLAIAPGAFATATAGSGHASIAAASAAKGYCLTFDKMLADDKAADAQPGVTYSVLGANGGLTESGSKPGPLYTKLREQKWAEWKQEKAKKIAEGASCIGYWEPASSSSN